MLAVFAALVIFAQTQARAEDASHFRIAVSKVVAGGSTVGNGTSVAMITPVPEPSARMLLLPFGVLIWLLRLKRTV